MEDSTELTGGEKIFSRKQFLAIVGSSIGGLLLSQFMFTKTSSGRDLTYGNNTYGSKRKR